MSEQDTSNEASLVPAGRPDLAPVARANPLVSRALAELANDRSFEVTTALSIDPRNAHYYDQRGMDWLVKKDYVKAIEGFGEAIRLDPHKADYYLSRAEAWLALKEVIDNAFSDGDYHKAIKLKQAARTDLNVASDKVVEDFDQAISGEDPPRSEN